MSRLHYTDSVGLRQLERAAHVDHGGKHLVPVRRFWIRPLAGHVVLDRGLDDARAAAGRRLARR